MYMLVLDSLMLLCVCGAGELTLVVDDSVYGLELTRQHKRSSGEELSALLCVVAMEESVCMNISSKMTQYGCRSLQTQLYHSFPWLHSAGTVCSEALADTCYGCVVECNMFLSLSIGAGLLFNSSAGVNVKWNDSRVCAQMELHAGASGLRAILEQSSHYTTQMTEHSQVRESQSFSNCQLLKVSQSLKSYSHQLTHKNK